MEEGFVQQRAELADVSVENENLIQRVHFLSAENSKFQIELAEKNTQIVSLVLENISHVNAERIEQRY